MFILSFLLAAATFAQAWSSGAFNRTSNQQTGNQISQQISPKALPGMPLTFIENRGQADARAAFLAQGRDTTAYFTAQGLTLAFTQHGDEKSARAKSNVRQRWNLKLDFVGANTAALPGGKDLANAQVSYFSGAREDWRTGIRSYSSIAYRDLWPGIDLVYSGTTNRLKYEFIVKPRADPQQIRLAYRGANAPLAVNQQGQLEIPTPFGVIRDDKPVSHQGNGKQVKTEFVVHEQAADGSQQYSFKVGKYDRRKTLVIDPAILIYSGFIGGSGDDEGHSIAVDSAGNAYVTGVTTSAQATFPETAGPDLTYNGRTDAFVAKIKADGSGLVYAGYIGGDGDDAGHSIAVDASGNAYVTGWTTSTQATFPVLGGLDATFNGAIDAFVAKINPSGTALTYCGYIGGDDEDEGLGIAVDGIGKAYVTGLTASTEATFPKLVGPGLLFKGAIDAFVARVKADGSGLDYAGYLGGSGDDQGRGIAVDAGGNAYVAGLTTSTEATFPMVGALDPSFNGGADAFVAKINSTGSAISYSGYIGGSGIDEAYGIAVDGSGNAYVTGRTTSTEATFPEIVGPDLTFNGMIDAFVAKVNSAGSALSYAGYIGGSGDDEGFGIAVDGAGAAHVTGRTTSSEATFPKSNAFDLTLNGTSDGFIAKVNPAGNALSYAGYLGGNGLEEGFGAAVNGLRQVYVAGRSTSGSGFPTMVGPGLNFGGASDAFAMRIDDSGVACPAITINPATLPNGFMGLPYNQTLTGSGGASPYSFTIISGGLPPNLALSPAGVISGASTQSGSFNFRVMATDSIGCNGTRDYTLTVIICTTITLSPGTLPQGTVGVAYNQTIMASGGTPNYTFSVSAGALPGGLSLNASTGALSGMPTTQGSFNFTVRATDGQGCFGELGYTLVIIGSGLQYYPLPFPVRLLDTRPDPFSSCVPSSDPLTGGGVFTLPVVGNCNGLAIPASAKAVVGNATVVNFQSSGGFITLFPSDAPLPNASNLNFTANHIVPNAFTVGLGSDGAIKIFTSATTNFIVDITGYYAPPGAGGLYFHPLPAPVRLLDTRPDPFTSCFPSSDPLVGGGTMTLPAIGDCSGATIPALAKALVGNATVVNFQSGGGFITLFPDGTAPNASNLNFTANHIVPNSFVAGLSAGGSFNIFTSASTNFIVDIAGYFSDQAVDVNGQGLLFYPLSAPARWLDTRPDPFVSCISSSTPLGAGSITPLQAQMICEGQTVPANAKSVLGNATVVNFQSGGGFVTLFPSDATLPNASNLNFTANHIVPNSFVVGLGGDGAFKIFTSAATNFIVDLSGYFAP